jgi:deoxyribonuclease-4
MSKIKLGCHVGMAGKEMFLASAKEAASYGANVFMLYTGAPQNTRRKDISELNIEAGWEYARQHGIEEIVVHAPYIINLANTVKPETYELAVEFLEKEIIRTAAMRSRIMVLHPGSHVNAGVEAGIAQVIKGLNTVLNQNDDDVYIALETMAGKGSEVGRTFEELKAIYDGVDKKDRLRVCFDTCHVNDAGYDIVNHYDEVFEEFDKVIGLDQIAVFHINDSMNPLGAHKDRHANIDKGSIGYETLHRLVHDERFIDVPKILETPWLAEEGSDKKTKPPYKEEIEMIKNKEFDPELKEKLENI